MNENNILYKAWDFVKSIPEKLYNGAIAVVALISYPFSKHEKTEEVIQPDYDVLKDKKIMDVLNRHNNELDYYTKENSLFLQFSSDQIIGIPLQSSHERMLEAFNSCIRQNIYEDLSVRGFQSDHLMSSAYSLLHDLEIESPKTDILRAAYNVDVSEVVPSKTDENEYVGKISYCGKDISFSYKNGKVSVPEVPEEVKEYIKRGCDVDISDRDNYLKDIAFRNIEQKENSLSGSLCYYGVEYDFQFDGKKFETKAPLPEPLLRFAGREAYAMSYNETERIYAGKNWDEIKAKRPINPKYQITSIRKTEKSVEGAISYLGKPAAFVFDIKNNQMRLIPEGFEKDNHLPNELRAQLEKQCYTEAWKDLINDHSIVFKNLKNADEKINGIVSIDGNEYTFLTNKKEIKINLEDTRMKEFLIAKLKYEKIPIKKKAKDHEER